LEELWIGKLRGRLNIANNEDSVRNIRNNGILDVARISDLRLRIVTGLDVATDAKFKANASCGEAGISIDS